ncbi:MAG: hypothetical protein ACRYG2_05210 [Janthinobacterium lividum]
MPEDDVQQPDGPPPSESRPESAPETSPAPPSWYAQRPRRRWPWVAVPVAVAVLATGGVLAHERAATTAGGAPVTVASAAPTAVVPAAPGEQATFALPGAGDTVLYLQAAGAVQRADLAGGAAVITPTPALVEPARFFAGAGWVASKTSDDPSGFVVRDGGGAQVLPVALQQAGRAYPAGSDDVWALPSQADRNGGRTAVQVDVDGDRVGDASIRVPGALGLPASHLEDSLLAVTASGTYEASATGSRRLSRGTLLGVGTDAVLTWDCNSKKRCDARVNRPGQAPDYLPSVRTSLRGLYGKDVTAAATSRGALSPDRRWVALELPKPTRSGARLVLVELKSGHRIEVPGALAGPDGTDQAAWTPNSRYLLALTDGRLRAVDSTTGTVVTIGGTPEGLRHLTVAGTATM